MKYNETCKFKITWETLYSCFGNYFFTRMFNHWFRDEMKYCDICFLFHNQFRAYMDIFESEVDFKFTNLSLTILYEALFQKPYSLHTTSSARVVTYHL